MADGHHRRLGLIVPADGLIDDEFWTYSGDGALPLVTRTRTPTWGEEVALTPRSLTAQAESPDLEDAAERLRVCAPAAAAYVDTSISFVRGTGGAHEIVERITRVLKCPTVVTSNAVIEALTALGCTRIVGLTPYPDDVNQTMYPFFNDSGVDLVHVEKLESNYDNGYTSIDLANLDPQKLVDACQRADRSDIDGLFISCTALRSQRAVHAVEELTQKPVVTAVQATMWSVQRHAGIAPSVRNGGRLFADGG